MKKLILFAAGILLLAACSKKNNPQPANPNAKFVGTWSATVDSTYTTSGGKTTSSALTYNGDYLWKLNADGTGTLADGTESMPVNFSADGNLLNITLTETGSPVKETIAFTVESITSSKMVLSATETGEKEVIYFVKQ